MTTVHCTTETWLKTHMVSNPYQIGECAKPSWPAPMAERRLRGDHTIEGQGARFMPCLAPRAALRSARHPLLRSNESLGKQRGRLVLELEVGDQPAVGVLLHD